MKKILIALLAMILSAFYLKAQVWTAQTSGTTQHILGIDFVDVNTGYAVGTGGVILKTTDGGAHWNAQASGTTESFYAVDFTDALHGVAVGDNQSLVRTTNGGVTWTPVFYPVFTSFRAVWFLNANVGFITGSVPSNILKTTDGGATWADISPTGFTGIYSIFFTDANTGYACDFDGFILKTGNGGASWTPSFVSPNHLLGLYFTDANNGYCVGGDWNLNTTVILKTNDAGATWSVTNNADPSANYLTDVEFVSANTGYAIGGNVQNNTGSILKTTNAGLSWTIENTLPGTTSRMYRLSLPSSTIGYACGLDGTILKITDTAPPEQPCDVKVINCIKYELLTITEDAAKNRTYRIRVTNNCASKLSYFAVQVPNGIQADEPLNNTVFTTEGGRPYKVRSPNFSPFYSVRYSSTTDSLANGQSDIFEYTLPAQAADPAFIRVRVRVEPQQYHEAHLNTFYCRVGQTPVGVHLQGQSTGLRQTPSKHSPTIFPNPNPGLFTVELPQPATPGMSFRVTDLAGRLVLQKQIEAGNERQTVQAGDLPDGLYFLQVVQDGRLLAVERFVKQH